MGELRDKFIKEPSLAMFEPIEQGVILTLHEKKHVMNTFQIKQSVNPEKKKRGQVHYALVPVDYVALFKAVTYHSIQRALKRLALEEILDKREGPNKKEVGYYLNPTFDAVLTNLLASQQQKV